MGFIKDAKVNKVAEDARKAYPLFRRTPRDG